MPGLNHGVHGGDAGRAEERPLAGELMSTQPAMRLRSQQNLDLEDLNVRNAQFKSFDTMVRMKLKPVWHRVGAKTRIHVAALTELRNLHTLVGLLK